MASLQSTAPLYLQMRQQLRHEILTGARRPHTRLGTEASLMEQFKVSRVTVRKALSGLVDEGLVRRVPGGGTFVNQRQARSHQTFARTGHVGIQSFNLHMTLSAWANEALRGINEVCEDQGMSTALFMTEPENPAAPANNTFEMALTQHRCDGVISLCNMGRQMYMRMLDLGVPVVLTFEYDAMDFASVSGDTFDTYEQLARLSIEAGWRVPALVKGPAPSRMEEIQGRDVVISGFRAVEGFRRGLILMGQPFRPSHVLKSDYRKEQAGQLVEALVRLEPRPDVLIVDGQEMAEALHERVPETITVIGTGPHAREWGPTIVPIPVREMGRRAADMLQRHIRNPAEPVAQSFVRIDHNVARQCVLAAYSRRVMNKESR